MNKQLHKTVWQQYNSGADFKASLGRKGLFGQTKINRRFYSGDQWHGARVGSDRPLVRHNIIKRIGEYKMSHILESVGDVSFYAAGVPTESSDSAKEQLLSYGVPQNGAPQDGEVNLVMEGLSNYFKVCAKRLNLKELWTAALKNAYISGTGLLYTYWNGNAKTGLFADDKRTTPILGDIACEVIDIENVSFSDPYEECLQSQDYIIISQRGTVGELRREAKANGVSEEERKKIVPDSGNYDEKEALTKKVTVLTKFYKMYDEESDDFCVEAVRVCKNAVIRPPFNTGLRLYPLAKINWEDGDTSYGESEITHLVPNQIAINRMLTAATWAVMLMGMPMMLVNGDVVSGAVTNNPGQVISVKGASEDFDRAIKFITPGNFSDSFQGNINALIENTLSHSGATPAALGNLNAQNTSAILAVREAATLPLKMFSRRFARFIEDIASIFAEFFVTMYAQRALAQVGEDGIWYLPFDGQRYRNLVIIPDVEVVSKLEEPPEEIAGEVTSAKPEKEDGE